MSDHALAAAVDELVPRLRTEPDDLVRIPSIPDPNFPPEPIHEAHALLVLLHAPASA